MEEFKSNNNESINLREQVVSMLKTLGFENEATKKLLNEWLDQYENKAEYKVSTTEGGNEKSRADARVRFEIAEAELFFDGGYEEKAFDDLYIALNVVQQENRSDLETIIRDKIAEFDRRMEMGL